MKCPQCFSELAEHAPGCDCGWAAPKHLHDPKKGLAARFDGGSGCAFHGCRNSGSLSRSTVGSGPWFCAEHFFKRNEAWELEQAERAKRALIPRAHVNPVASHLSVVVDNLKTGGGQ